MSSIGLKNITNFQLHSTKQSSKSDKLKVSKHAIFIDDENSVQSDKLKDKASEEKTDKKSEKALGSSECTKQEVNKSSKKVIAEEKFEIFQDEVESKVKETQEVGIQTNPTFTSSSTLTDVTIPFVCPEMPISDLYAAKPTVAYLRRLAERLQKDIEREREELFELMHEKDKLAQENAKMEKEIMDCISYGRREFDMPDFGVEKGNSEKEE